MDFTAFLFTVGIVLIFAKFFAYLFEKLNLPGVLGEIVLGIIMGSIYLYGSYFGTGVGAWIRTWITVRAITPFEGVAPFRDLSHLGIIMLLFIASLDTDVTLLKATTKVATISTMIGVIVPLAFGSVAGILLGFDARESFIIGILLTATSIGITVRTLMDIHMLSSDVGTASVTASVMDDFVGIVLIIFAVSAESLETLGVYLTIFFVITLIAGWFYMPYVTKFIRKYIKTEKALFTIIIGLMLLFAALAQFSFTASIEGAYFAGITLSRVPEKKLFINDVRTLGYGFFIPLFFVYVGAQLDIGVFGTISALILSGVIVTVGIVGKILGRSIGARIGGFNWRRSWQMGVGSVPRMEIALVSLAIAITANAIKPDHVSLFVAATLVFVTVTTLITPILVKWSFNKEILAAKTSS